MDYQENTEKLSPEEMDRRKEEMLTFYKDSMPYLDAQLGYETKLMEVDEVRFKRLQISMQSAMMLAQNENQEEYPEEYPEKVTQESSPKPKPEAKKKKLKRKKPLRTS